MDTRNQPAESLGYYPSEYITGRKSNIPRSTAGVCLKPEFICQFWRRAVRVIWDSPRCANDGEVFTSEEMDVFLGPWDIDIRHHIETEAERRYDVNFGEYETVHVRDNESFEVVGAYDMDNDMNLPGIIYLLNDFYKKHQSEIFKTNNL